MTSHFTQNFKRFTAIFRKVVLLLSRSTIFIFIILVSIKLYQSSTVNCRNSKSRNLDAFGDIHYGCFPFETKDSEDTYTNLGCFRAMVFFMLDPYALRHKVRETFLYPLSSTKALNKLLYTYADARLTWTMKVK